MSLGIVGFFQERHRHRQATIVDLRAGLALFREVTPQIDAATKSVAAFRGSASQWIVAAEALLEELPSGFVVDDPYVDPKILLLQLTWKESKAAIVALETWRRFKLHEALYRVANDKFLVELTRQRSLPLSEAAPPVVRELVARMGGELEKMSALAADFVSEALVACLLIRDESKLFNKLSGSEDEYDGMDTSE